MRVPARLAHHRLSSDHLEQLFANAPDISMCAVSSDDEVHAFARRYLHSVVAAAKSSLPTSVARVTLPLPILIFQCFATLFAAIVMAGDTAATIDCVCWPAMDASCAANDLEGAALGLLGAAATGVTESWRSRDEEVQHPPVTNSILIGVLPLSATSSALANDHGVGERAAHLVLESPSNLPSAFLHLLGTTAACAWAHGVLQQGTSMALTQAALTNAVRNLPADPEATWWWPAVASGSALAPVVAAVVTVALTVAVDAAVSGSLRPMAKAEALACEEAVLVARERSRQRFALEGFTPGEAAIRDDAFQSLAGEWQQRVKAHDARDATASVLRASIGATVYAVSGNSQWAPLIAGWLGGSAAHRVPGRWWSGKG